MPVPTTDHIANDILNNTNGTSKTSNGSIGEKLLRIVNVSHLRFAWFLGNATAVFSTLFYLLSYRNEGLSNTLYYKLTLLGAIDTFGIALYQNKKSFSDKSSKVVLNSVLQDDNFHYLYNAVIWLLLPVKNTLVIVPFFIFSLFHFTNFISNEVLPELGILSGISSLLKDFILKHHETSRRIAAGAEILLLLNLVGQSLLWVKYSWISLVLYSVFIKLKSESSIFTKSILKNWEVRVDGIVSLQAVPASVKSYWIKFKRTLKQLNQYSIIKKIDETSTKTN